MTGLRSRQLLVLLLAGVFLGSFWTVILAAPARPAYEPPLFQADGTPTPQPRLYFPLIFQNYPEPPSIFGVQINSGMVGQVITQAVDLNPGWVRHDGISWASVEHEQGHYDWSRVAAAEAELRQLGEHGLNVVVSIQGTPDWAQKYPGYRCGLMKEEALDDFANFVAAAVRRYSTPPYNVRYWEIWNEPDVAYQIAGPTWGFGCLGDLDDPYYGGGDYARILQAVYPAVKAANPAARVVFGGLLLDCDPTNPPQGKDCSSALFLEGALREGAGASFDILAYHAYPHWAKLDSRADWDLQHFAWKHRGGIFLGKLDFVRQVMAQYGVNKPIMMNEGGLLCYPLNPDCNEGGAYKAQFHRDQANYVVRLYVRGWAQGLVGVMWYTLNGPGWRQGGLLDENQQPRPAYQALRFLASQLDGARYEGPLSTGDPNLEAYTFRRGTTRISVYWRNDGNTTVLELPAGATLYNALGDQLIPLNGTAFQVTFDPVLVVHPAN